MDVRDSAQAFDCFECERALAPGHTKKLQQITCSNCGAMYEITIARMYENDGGSRRLVSWQISQIRQLN